jgi:hypothetical protein
MVAMLKGMLILSYRRGFSKLMLISKTKLRMKSHSRKAKDLLYVTLKITGAKASKDQVL